MIAEPDKCTTPTAEVLGSASGGDGDAGNGNLASMVARFPRAIETDWTTARWANHEKVRAMNTFEFIDGLVILVRMDQFAPGEPIRLLVSASGRPGLPYAAAVEALHCDLCRLKRIRHDAQERLAWLTGRRVELRATGVSPGHLVHLCGPTRKEFEAMRIDRTICQGLAWAVPPPPPQRVTRSRLLGGGETRNSRRIAQHWRQLLDGWGRWTVEQRRAEAEAYWRHLDRIGGPWA